MLDMAIGGMMGVLLPMFFVPEAPKGAALEPTTEWLNPRVN